ncbi:MAG: acetyltransferase [Glaciecola sp.]|jgi:sugar O-acyltransferase (sialic acid O-acetyltransferase NeuD family)
MKCLIIVGGGGLGKEVVWLAKECGRKVFGILDDSSDKKDSLVQGVRRIGGVLDWTKYPSCDFIIAIGSPRTRLNVLSKMESLGKPSFATLIHPDVKFSDTVQFGCGSIIFPGSILTSDVVVGEHNIVNSNSTIAHDCSFGNFVTIAPMVAISGNVVLENLVEVGTGAAVRQGLTISEGGMLGMGAVLTKSVPERTVFVGNPAKKLKEIS